jgi:hypothetical protein
MGDITETPEAPSVEPEANLPYLIGVRLREPLQAEDHQTAMEDLHFGDVVVETGQGRGGRCGGPSAPCANWAGSALSHGAAAGHRGETAEWRDRRSASSGTPSCRRRARGRGLQLKIMDVEITTRVIANQSSSSAEGAWTARSPGTAHEFRSRIGCGRSALRDTTSSWTGSARGTALLLVYLKNFGPISVNGQGPGHAAHGQSPPRQLRPAQVLPALRVLHL